MISSEPRFSAFVSSHSIFSASRPCFAAEAGADDGDAARHLHDRRRPARPCRRRVERLHLRAEAGGRQQRDAHAGDGRVEREMRGAVRFGRRVDARNGVTDQLEIGRLLQRDLVRHRQLRRIGDERAVCGRLAALRMRDDAIGRRQLARRHLPAGRRDRYQHRAGLAAGFAQLLPRVRHGRAAARPLHRAEREVRVAFRIGRRAFDAHVRPVGVEPRRRSSRCPYAPHFDVLRDDGDGAVGRDAQECIRRETGGGRGRGERAAAEAAEVEADGQADGGHGARGLQERAARRTHRPGVVEFDRHGQAPSVAAASWIAARMRA